MNGSTIILRLIDVVLILLFGFISISEISRQTKITLPKSENIQITNPDKESILLIAITDDGHYLVENEAKRVSDPKDLKIYIEYKQKEYESKKSQMRVRIRSNFNTPVRYTVMLANLCDILNIPKSIDVEHRGS